MKEWWIWKCKLAWGLKYNKFIWYDKIVDKTFDNFRLKLERICFNINLWEKILGIKLWNDINKSNLNHFLTDCFRYTRAFDKLMMWHSIINLKCHQIFHILHHMTSNWNYQLLITISSVTKIRNFYTSLKKCGN